MSVEAIGSGSVAPVAPIAGLGEGPAVAPSGSSGFGAVMAQVLGAAAAPAPTGGLSVPTIGRLSELQRVQGTVDELAVKAATGQLQDPSQYTIAATEATLATQMTVALRNKAVDAYGEVMRMQL